MKTIAIVFHNSDYDGILSNEVCRYHLNRLHPEAQIHSYGWDYGRPVPDDEARTHRFTVEGGSANATYQWVDYDQIYIVDLSVDELMAKPELQSKIVWIDHHASAIKKWDQPPAEDTFLPDAHRTFAGYRIDGVAACRLCWQWFVGFDLHPPTKQSFVDRAVSEPRLIRLAGEYDVWDHRDPDAKALQFGLRTLNEDSIRGLIEEEFAPNGCVKSDFTSTIIREGRAIKAYCDKQNDEYAKVYAHTIFFEGLTFCALNIGQRGNSDLLRAGIKPEHDALFAWRFDGTQACVSLYHAPGREHYDLSEIAKRYGGGGHRGACGFRVPLVKLAVIFEGMVRTAAIVGSRFSSSEDEESWSYESPDDAIQDVFDSSDEGESIVGKKYYEQVFTEQPYGSSACKPDADNILAIDDLDDSAADNVADCVHRHGAFLRDGIRALVNSVSVGNVLLIPTGKVIAHTITQEDVDRVIGSGKPA